MLCVISTKELTTGADINEVLDIFSLYDVFGVHITPANLSFTVKTCRFTNYSRGLAHALGLVLNDYILTFGNIYAYI